uniref:AI-2E family transporter n=1 Tax=Undibacterium sp. TaxID=1914977 RepID=UPI00374CC2F1
MHSTPHPHSQAISDPAADVADAEAPASDSSETVSALDARFPDPSQPPAQTRVHVDARGWAITLLAVVAFVFALSFARKFFIPLTFAIFIAYTLSPLVAALQRIHIPRLIGTSVLMVSILCGIGMHMNSLRDEFDSILVQLPAATRKLSTELNKMQYGQATLMQKMQAAAVELEKATSQATGTPKPDFR